MPVAKKSAKQVAPVKKKTAFVKKKVHSTAFQGKVDRLNALLSTALLQTKLHRVK